MEPYKDPFLNSNFVADASDETVNKTSMAFWLPKIFDLPIPMPDTVLIPVTYGEGMDYLSEETHKKVELAAINAGFPCFIKTDLCAGKHDYVNTCYVDSLETLHGNLEALRDDNFCHDQIFRYIAVRQYIQLDASFKAFHDLPISPERRYFVNDGKTICHHRYWIEDAIEFFNIKKDPKGVKSRSELLAAEKERCLPLLRKMNYESKSEIELLTSYSDMVAERLPGYWSVDFALASDCKWYLIDMAEGHRSWHDDDCPIRIKMDTL